MLFERGLDRLSVFDDLLLERDERGDTTAAGPVDPSIEGLFAGSSLLSGNLGSRCGPALLPGGV